MQRFFEIVLKGFDGGTDVTDHLIIWVRTSFELAELVSWLTSERLYGDGDSAVIQSVFDLDRFEDSPGLDFDLPAQGPEFKLRVLALASKLPELTS